MSTRGLLNTLQIGRTPIVSYGVLGVLVSLAVFVIARQAETLRIRQEFHRHAADRVGAIRLGLRERLSGASTLASLFSTGETLDEGRFQELASKLMGRGDGVQTLAWVPRVTQAERERFEKTQRAGGHAEFQVLERGVSNELVKAAERAEYFPIRYAQPTTGREKLFGLDVASEPIRGEAIRRALATGKPAATSRSACLLQSGHPQAFIVFFPAFGPGAHGKSVPVRGFVLEAFHFRDLVDACLRNLKPTGLELLLVDVSDSAKENRLLLETDNGADGPPVPDLSVWRKGLHEEIGVQVADRCWGVMVRPTEEFVSSRRTWMPYGLLGAALLLTALVLGLLWLERKRTGEFAAANDELKRLASQRLQTLHALQASEGRYRLLFECSPHPMWLYETANLGILAVNEAAIQHYGYTREEFLKLSILDLRPEEDVPLLMESLKGGELATERMGEFRHRKKDGTIIQVEVRSQTLTFEGRLARLVLATDITERRRTERELRESEERFATAFRSAAVGMALQTPEGRFLRANDALCQTLGYAEGELLARTFQELTYGPDLDASLEFQQQMLRGEKASCRFEKRYVGKDGRIISALVNVALVRDSAGGPALFIIQVQDVTEQKLLEQQFLRAQRMESIGTLAAGIAHDLNNILAPILMSSQILQASRMDPEDQEVLSTIQASAQRGAEIVKQVLTFARGVAGERVWLQPRHLAREMQKIAQETFPKNILIRAELPKETALVSGDATQLHQVLMNLCVNARDAMPEGGELTIRTRNVEVTESTRSLFGGAKPGPYVLLEVQDTGQGIPPNVMERIFEPFFTTKGQGEGTGLGLSTVLGIVRSHGGFVDVETALGSGTTFRVYLPTVSGTLSPEASASPALAPKGHNECILLVDDEASIRSIAEKTLVKHGYQVLTAANGQEAISLLPAHADQIRAVVTDVIMPVMDGLAMVKQLRSTHPELPIIACSGWGNERIHAEMRSLGVRNFLTKPYPATQLLSALHEQLG